MIDCSRVAVSLMDYAMDDLSEDGYAAVEEHLAACPPCAQLVEEYRAVSHMVHDAMEVELTDEEQAQLDATVMAAIALTG